MLVSIFGQKPKLIPSLIALPGIALLLALGVWQLARHTETGRANAFRAERLALPPVPIDAALRDPEANRFRRVRVEGRFAHDREILIYARSQRGNEGVYVVTPVLREGAAPILVNRGWAPTERRDPARRAAGQVSGAVAIEGVLRDEPRRTWLMPDNDPQGNRWFWFELPAMVRVARVPDAPLVYVEADRTPNPGGFPIGGQTQEQLYRPHLQYAFTWFALAIGLAAVYVLYHRKLAKESR